MVLVASDEMESYFGDLEKRADDCYSLVSKARKAGFDPALEPEIPRAKDLADRVETQVGPPGIAPRIRAVSENNDRESTALIIAKELAGELRSEGIEEALEQAVRTSLSILTEGVLVAPTEGVVRVSTMINQNNTRCAAIYYAGPIRAAGGTAQALSVLIADVVRRELGLDSYIPTPAEIERYKEEIPLYKRAVNLQYVPSSNEIDTIAKSCPICITGESTERIEVAGNRDLPRVETNSLRGGACLVLAEGLCLKAAKVLKHVDRLGISGWDFLRTYTEKKREATSGNVKEHKYLKDVLAGRPIFAFPDEPGGFRLRYGRTRLAGLASMSIHPSTMVALDSFAAIGTQIKIQLPGKATAGTPCDSIEGPSVLLKDGIFTRLDDYEKAKIVVDQIDRIIDLGEILVPVGEFMENNHPLEPSGWCTDWWDAIIKDLQIDAYEDELDFPSLLEFSKRHQVPLHPKYTYYWGDLDTKEINDLRNQLIRNGEKVKDNSFPLVYKEIFLRLGIFFRISDNSIVLEDGVEPLFHTLGLEVKNNSLESSMDVLDTEDSVALISHLSGVIIKDRAPTRIGASMGRPEKAKERRMKPPPNVLFPLGEAGGSQRLVNTALKSSSNRGFSRGRPGIIEVETQLRYCKECRKETVSIHCCKTQTMVKDQARRRSVDVSELITKAMNNTRTGILPKIKGVKGLMSDQKVPECLEKGILRAKYDLRVYKDGTLRYDMIDLPITHFYPKEIGLTVDKAKQLGYLKDINGQPLKSDDQLLEMKVQDLIVSERSGNWLVKVSNFVDEVLSKLYGMEPFYGLEPNSRPEELIGNLLICLSPHTSAGVLTRLIGFT
ncbi:MAG TPA: DNA polymerase II large subunit, partial [Candidatus Poseidoniia archaeon]|nr:DNA polymerase II large subunit [Candidatus Poseidoniia archaeon]